MSLSVHLFLSSQDAVVARAAYVQSPVASSQVPIGSRHVFGGVLHVFGEPATHAPLPSHLSSTVHFFPSSHDAVVGRGAYLQSPVEGSQVPAASKHWPGGALHVFAGEPVHVPLASHVSPLVHLLPSSQEAPTLTA